MSQYVYRIHTCQRQVTGTSLWWKLNNTSSEGCQFHSGCLVLSWLESLANLPICFKFVLNDDDETCPKSPWHTDFVVVVCRSAHFILRSCGHKKTILVEMFLLSFWPFLKKSTAQRQPAAPIGFHWSDQLSNPPKMWRILRWRIGFWGTGDW